MQMIKKFAIDNMITFSAVSWVVCLKTIFSVDLNENTERPMKPETNNPRVSPVFLLAVGFIAGAIVVGSSWFATRESSPAYNIIRDKTVSYVYQESPGSVTSGGNTDVPVDSIQFHPGYIVVTKPGGHGDLFAVDRLKRFNFKPQKPKRSP